MSETVALYGAVAVLFTALLSGVGAGWALLAEEKAKAEK